MKKQVGLVLLEYIPVQPGGSQSSKPVYKVSQTRNTIEWSIGAMLSPEEVHEILRRKGAKEVDVIVKSLEFHE